MYKKIVSIILFFLIVLSLYPFQKTMAYIPDDPKSFLVKSTNIDKTSALLKNLSIEIKNTIPELNILKIETTQEKINAVASDQSTLFVEENKKTRLSYVAPNDPLFPRQNYLRDSNFLNAWDITQGNGSIIVSVIDSGVNYNHEDLKDIMWENTRGEYGYDFVNRDNDPMDEYFHGSMVAGIIGAKTNNGKGIAGGANVKIMAVRAIGARDPGDPPDTGEVADLIEGITYSVNNGAKIINVSLGTPDNSSALDNAISFAINSGCVVVAAVGNAYSPSPPRSTIDNPARNPSVIGVSALNEYNQKPDYANYGSGIAVTALGNNIYSTGWSQTRPNSSYYTGSGTSFSAPQVTAAVALLLSKDPSLTPSQVKKRIISGAKKINGMDTYSQYYGYGKLDAYGVLTYDKFPPEINVSLYDNGNGSYLISGEIKDDFTSINNVMGNIQNSNIGEVRYYIGGNRANGGILNEIPGSIIKINTNTPLMNPENKYITIEATDTSGNTQVKNLYLENVLPPPVSNNITDYKASLIFQSPYVTLSTGQTRSMSLTFRNNGNSGWDKNKVRLATTRSMDRASIFADSSWASNNRIYMQENHVAPGNLASFNFTVTAPPGISGNYKEYFNLVVDGVGWMNDIGLYWLITVEPPSYHAQYVNQSPYLTLGPGEEADVWVEYKNTGSIVWDSGNVKLGTNRPTDRYSVFYNNLSGSGWRSANRINLEQQTVNPGEIGRFSFKIKAPSQSNIYTEHFRPVADGFAWMEDYGLYWNFTVK